MKIKISPELNIAEIAESDAIVLNLPEDKKIIINKLESFKFLDKKTKEALLDFINKTSLQDNDIKTIFIPKGKISKVMLVIGKQEKQNLKNLTINIRKIIKTAKSERINSISLITDNFLINQNHLLTSKTIIENALMAQFDFAEQFKQKPKQGWAKIKFLKIFGDTNNIKEIKEGVRQGSIIGQEVNHARILANMPPGRMTPESLVEAAWTAADATGFDITVFDEPEIKERGMGGILGVASGSKVKPKFIILEYLNGGPEEKPIAFIGKGVTFDSGGLNIKPSDSMNEMHLDMSGGAAVIHGIAAIARLKLPINVYGFIPAVENMPSGSSYRPGDILKTMSGKTIEVLNTDAEGRIILADAIEYAKTKKPSVIIDIATLTGAAIVALGQRITALFTKDKKLQEFLISIGESSGDYTWPMPLWDEYEKDIEGSFGDVANIGKTKYGGAITGASFLWYFAKPELWAHLDIAPTMTTIEDQSLTKGASGVGVRFLVELAKKWKEFCNTQ